MKPAPCRIDVDRRLVFVGDKAVEVAPKEFDLLRYLAEANGKVISRDALAATVWGQDAALDIQSRTIDQCVARLRRKIGWDAVRTVPKAGYSIAVQPVKVTEVWGKVGTIDRQFGSKIGVTITLHVPGNVLPELKAGARIRVA